MSEKVVLVVDDEERILASVKRSLRREGYRLLTAQGPQQAPVWTPSSETDNVPCP